MSQGVNFERETGGLRLQLGERELFGYPDNSVIYLHQFAYRGLDHIYVWNAGDQEEPFNVSCFRGASDHMMQEFDGLVDLLIRNHFPVNHPGKPSIDDQRIFERHVNHFVGFVSMDDLERPWELS